MCTVKYGNTVLHTNSLKEEEGTSLYKNYIWLKLLPENRPTWPASRSWGFVTQGKSGQSRHFLKQYR
jgi:hypothetical protein